MFILVPKVSTLMMVKHEKQSKIVPIIISLFLFIIPFFWISPGEANMGGDDGSLYYYDPINIIKKLILYEIYPYGTGLVQPRFYFLPFVSLFSFFNLFFQSPYLISVLHISVKLSVGFFSMYLIVKELISRSKEKINIRRSIPFLNIKEVIAVLSGIFYILSPVLTKEDGFINPIPSHDQVFLNPLIFYLVLKYFITKKMKYLWSLLLLTFIFAHSFSYSAVPALFSFYPLAFLFIIIYVLFIVKEKLPIKGIIFGIIFFLFLHLFHIVPQVIQLFDVGTDINRRVFSLDDRQATVTTFYGIIGFASFPNSILLPSISGSIWQVFAFLSPVVILLGFLKNKARSKLLLVTSAFFLLTLFFVSAKITHSSIKLYEMFFWYIPGFGMFRWFFVKWMFVFIFFYTLLFGQSLFLILASLRKTKIKIILLILFVYLIGSSWVFIKGDQFDLRHFQSAQVKRLTVMDPQYEKMLEFIRNVPYDGKILQFPFSDFNFQVVHGINNGAYVGTSTIGQLTGVKDFAGYWNTAPYSEAFLQLSKEKNYPALKTIFGLLNIRYIMHNADPNVYDSVFFGRPFEYVRQFLPSTQKEYAKFIMPLVGDKLFEAGPYRLYLTDEESYVPHIYIPKQTTVYKYNPKHDKYYNAASSFLLEQAFAAQSAEKRSVYIEKNECISKSLVKNLCIVDISFDSLPKVFFKKINPVKYQVKITNAQMPFLLVLSDAFHKDWKLFASKDVLEETPVKTYFNENILEGKSVNIFLNEKTFETLSLKSIPEEQHISVNAYANAWYITPQDMDMKQEASFIIEMTGQRVFYVTLIISLVTLCIFIILGFILLATRKF